MEENKERYFRLYYVRADGCTDTERFELPSALVPESRVADALMDLTRAGYVITKSIQA